MAVITLAECKSVLGVTDTAHDARITALIPYVENDIRAYCGRAFCDTSIYRASQGAFDFVRGATSTTSTDADKIYDADDWMSTSGFKAGMQIFISGGSNEGYYDLAAATSSMLTLTSTGAIIDQSQTTYHRWPGTIAIARVQWPKGLKTAAAKMVWHLIDKAKEGDVKSESVDDYSVTYAGSNAYPARVCQALKPFRRVILV